MEVTGRMPHAIGICLCVTLLLATVAQSFYLPGVAPLDFIKVPLYLLLHFYYTCLRLHSIALLITCNFFGSCCICLACVTLSCNLEIIDEGEVDVDVNISLICDCVDLGLLTVRSPKELSLNFVTTFRCL